MFPPYMFKTGLEVKWFVLSKKRTVSTLISPNWSVFMLHTSTLHEE